MRQHMNGLDEGVPHGVAANRVPQWPPETGEAEDDLPRRKELPAHLAWMEELPPLNFWALVLAVSAVGGAIGAGGYLALAGRLFGGTVKSFGAALGAG